MKKLLFVLLLICGQANSMNNDVCLDSAETAGVLAFARDEGTRFSDLVELIEEKETSKERKQKIIRLASRIYSVEWKDLEEKEIERMIFLGCMKSFI